MLKVGSATCTSPTPPWPISPGRRALPPKLPAERLHLFAGSADRIVPPVQPLKLAAHWQREVHWYPGAHLTFRGERAVVRCIDDAMAGAGWKRPRSV